MVTRAQQMLQSYVYWTVHHLDNWIKIDQLDVISFIISLFTAQHVHRTRYVITQTHDVRIYSGNIIKNTQHARELKNHRTPQQTIFTETRLLKQTHTLRLITRH